VGVVCTDKRIGIVTITAIKVL